MIFGNLVRMGQRESARSETINSWVAWERIRTLEV